MSNQGPFRSVKKTFSYNFFPTKEEEEACKANNTPWVPTRELIEIRDKYPPPKFDLRNPWKIKKRITRDEIAQGMLLIPFYETFQYILRYWKLDMAKDLAEKGYGVHVGLWDVTEQNVCRKYEGGSACLWKLDNDGFSLSCMELFNDRGLGVGDEIWLYWNPTHKKIMFKLFSKKVV